MNLSELVMKYSDVKNKPILYDKDLNLPKPYLGYATFGRDYSEDILNEFIKRYIITDSKFINLIGSTNRARSSIHIRLTDYIDNNYKFDFYYYLKCCFDNIPRDITDIDVYSDDINTAKELYDDILHTRFSCVNYIKNDTVTDLYLLSMYKYKILWNSTFSYWSGYISNVIYNYDNLILVPNFHFKLLLKGLAWHLNPKWSIIKVV